MILSSSSMCEAMLGNFFLEPNGKVLPSEDPPLNPSEDLSEIPNVNPSGNPSEKRLCRSWMRSFLTT